MLVRLTEQDCWALAPLLVEAMLTLSQSPLPVPPRGQVVAFAVPRAPAVLGCSGLLISSLLPSP